MNFLKPVGHQHNLNMLMKLPMCFKPGSNFKLKFYKDTQENIVISFDQEDLNIRLDSKYKEVTLSSSKAKKYELLCNSNTTSPNRLFLKLLNYEILQSAAKNLAIDTFISKNIRTEALFNR